MEETEEIVEESFKNRVAQVAISCAAIYRDSFVEYDYLVCSEAFGNTQCQEIKAEANNYLHLIGVNTSLSSNVFYQKAATWSASAMLIVNAPVFSKFLQVLWLGVRQMDT